MKHRSSMLLNSNSQHLTLYESQLITTVISNSRSRLLLLVWLSCSETFWDSCLRRPSGWEEKLSCYQEHQKTDAGSRSAARTTSRGESTTDCLLSAPTPLSSVYSYSRLVLHYSAYLVLTLCGLALRSTRMTRPRVQRTSPWRNPSLWI